jgi:glyoxylase-like metal-dependent hydrolase (beta-lactamase superfamily II)
MLQIVPGLWTFTRLLVGRVYAIEDPDGITLIDGGMGLAANRVLRQLAALGHPASSVKRILLTHAHPDHAGGLPELRERTGAQLIVPAGERDTVEGNVEIARAPEADLTRMQRLMRPPSTTLKPTPVDRVISDGDVLGEVMGGLHVVATPGHSPDHVSYWQPEQRILFCGDVLMRIPLPRLTLPIAAFTVSMAQNKQSIKRVAEMDVDVLCLGHGTPLRNAAPTIRAFAQKIGVL